MKDTKNKHKRREHDWHPKRSWLRRYLSELRQLFEYRGTK